MDAVNAGTPAGSGSPGSAGYRRSAGSPRGEARRRELLDRVTDDLAVSGLVDFSLRRAARAAGTTHKVLLYYFDSADDLHWMRTEFLFGRAAPIYGGSQEIQRSLVAQRVLGMPREP